MSKVKRYVVTYDGGFVTWEYREAVESDKGENIWIMESDYDALAAEYERLRSASFVTAVPSEEYEKLKAENERLRRAGNAMYNCAVQDSTGLWLLNPFQDWHKMNHPRTERGGK